MLSRATQATFGSARSVAITASICVVSAILTRAATIAGEISAPVSPLAALNADTRVLIALIVARAVVIERYATEPAASTPSIPFLKPITIRFVDGRRAPARLATVLVACRAARENVGAKALTVFDVTTPVIVAPLLATNDTDPPVIW